MSETSDIALGESPAHDVSLRDWVDCMTDRQELEGGPGWCIDRESLPPRVADVDVFWTAQAEDAAGCADPRLFPQARRLAPIHLAMYGRFPYTGVMTTALKNHRIEIRLTADQKRTIEQAATISGRSVTDFSVPLLVDEATEVIRQDRELRMSAQAWDTFNEILDRPAKPIAELAELFRRPSVFID